MRERGRAWEKVQSVKCWLTTWPVFGLHSKPRHSSRALVIPIPGGRDRVGTWNSVKMQLGLFENIQAREKPYFRNHVDKTEDCHSKVYPRMREWVRGQWGWQETNEERIVIVKTKVGTENPYDKFPDQISETTKWKWRLETTFCDNPERYPWNSKIVMLHVKATF